MIAGQLVGPMAAQDPGPARFVLRSPEVADGGGVVTRRDLRKVLRAMRITCGPAAGGAECAPGQWCTPAGVEQ